MSPQNQKKRPVSHRAHHADVANVVTSQNDGAKRAGANAQLTPADRLIRLPEVLERIPVSKSSWWEGVKTGRFPAPVKLGPHTTCWRLSEILKLVERGIDGVKPKGNGAAPSGL
jgi:prophage regulatory protein